MVAVLCVLTYTYIEICRMYFGFVVYVLWICRLRYILALVLLLRPLYVIDLYVGTNVENTT